MTDVEITKILGIDSGTLNEIDKGIIPLLVELNKKGYKTCGSCEGHPNEDGKWNIALGFAHEYHFSDIPILTSYKIFRDNRLGNKKVSVKLFMNWDGVGEENRQHKLAELLLWAKSLPTHNKNVQVITYTLIGTNTKGKSFRLKTTTDIQEIRLEMSKEKNQKYTMHIIEKVTEEW